jgi:D-3-phosphoglycerate dehydrogenase
MSSRRGRSPAPRSTSSTRSRPRRTTLTLDNFIAAPHVAGVTKEAVERMAVVAVQNILSVIDGVPIRDNVVNPEVLG